MATTKIEKEERYDSFDLETTSNDETKLTKLKEELETLDNAFEYNITDPEHTAISPTATAVPTTETDHAVFSDDDAPKVLTTLESVTKSKRSDSQNSIDIIMQNDKMSIESLEDDVVDIVPIETESEIAQQQLAKLEKMKRKRGRASNTAKSLKLTESKEADDKDMSNDESYEILIEHVDDDIDNNVEEDDVDDDDDDDDDDHVDVAIVSKTEEKISNRKKTHNRLTQVLQETMLKTPTAVKVETTAPGTIEIPREFILELDESIPPELVNEEPATNEDLIAILEGTDDTIDDEANDQDGSVSEVTLHESPVVSPRVHSKSLNITPEQEKEMALKQMMTLPGKRNRRKPTKKLSTDLVNSLMSEWSDNETKSDDVPEKVKIIRKAVKRTQSVQKQPEEVEINIKVSPVLKASTEPTKTNKPKAKMIDNISISPSTLKERRNSQSKPVIKSNRIIKKKIIWDPDAPETGISYASLVHKTSPSESVVPNKARVENEPAIKVKKPSQANENKVVRKRRIDSPSSGLRKKKTSEIEKLLGDEGAVNMLYSLEHENNNADLMEAESNLDDNNEPDLEVKARTVKNIVTNQNRSTNVQRARVKRAPTPQMPVTVVTTPKKEITGRRRTISKTSAASSWDYIYSGRDHDDSMIVRRRSNSSYSSTTSPNRLSIEGPSNLSTVGLTPPSETTKAGKSKDNFEFVKPSVKKQNKNEMANSHSIISDLKNNVRKVKRPPQVSAPESRPSTGIQLDELLVKHHKNFVHLVLAPKNDKFSCAFTIPLMKSVIHILTELAAEDSCRTVFITSERETFCNGLDYTSIIQSTVEKRRNAVRELATTVKSFFQALANFKKPLVAGVNGHCVGIGVTILPLFDLVYADDTWTCQLLHGKIGHLPEGCSILSETHKVNKTFVNEMIYLGEKYSTAIAQSHGLINDTFNSETFQKEILTAIETISSQSCQAIQSSKSILQQQLLLKLDDLLEKEQKLLIQHWCSIECQEKLKQFLVNGKW